MPELDGVWPAFVSAYDQVTQHAEAEYPREACGVMLRLRGGAIVYRPCRNVAPAGQRRDAFAIDPQDWAAAEDEGDVLAIVHSHPDADATPSEADKRECFRSGLAWFVVALPSKAWNCIWPKEPLPLEGRQFEHAAVDCYTLIQDYFSEKVAVVLPDFERTDDWWVRRENLYVRHFAEAGFVDMGRATPLRLHDVVLMQVHSDEPNHAAVFVGPVHGRDSILHHLHGRLSGHEPYTGYWLRHTTHHLRHRSLL